MKRVKSLIAFVLTILMVTSSIPLNAFADDSYYDSDASGVCDDFYWTYTKETDTVYINATEQNEEGYISGNSDSGWLPLYETQADLESGEVYPFGILEGYEYCAFKNVVIGKDIKGIDNVYFLNYTFPLLESVVFEDGTQIEQIDMGLFSSTKLKSIEIPSSVKSIEAEAFSASSIENITLPEGLEYIGEQAFMECNLGDLVIPSTVNWIDVGAFENAGITNLSFAKGSVIEKIESYAFEYNEKLTSVTIPASDIKFGVEVFSDCEKLETVIFEDNIVDGVPTGVIKIGDYMFQGCPVLQNIKFPKTLETIGQYAFYYAFSDNEEKVTLDLSNTSLNKVYSYAFSQTKKLDTVKFPNSLIEIRNFGFYNSNITSIDLSNTGLTELSSSLFRSCTKLTDVELPSCLEGISGLAFRGSAIKNIELPDGLYYIEQYAFENTKSLRKLDFPDSLEEISSYAFDGSNIENIDLSKCTNDLYIGPSAFQNTTSLETVRMPEEYFTEIPSSAFYHSSLKTIDIPCVTKVGQNAFAYTTNLESISFPVGCTTILNGTFNNSNGLKELYLPYTVNNMTGTVIGGSTNLNKLVYSGTYDITKYLNFDSVKNATVYGLTGSKLDDYCYSKNIEFIPTDSSDIDVDPTIEVINGTWEGGTWKITTVGRNTLTIGGEGDLTNKCFDENGEATRFVTLIAKHKIDCINIEEGITSIPNEFAYGNNIYYGSPNVAILRLPSTLKTIGDYAFSHNNLSHITLPDSLTSIGASAFEKNNIADFDANDSLNFIGSAAFANNPIESINLGNVKTISTSAFANTAIKSLTIGEKVEKIGHAAFAGIPTLTTIDLSKATSIKRIEDRTFYSSGVKSITIPKNVEYIGSAAFGNCTNLTNVIISNYNVEIYSDKNAVTHNEENAFGFDENGNKLKLSFKGAFGSTAYDYATKYGFTFTASFGDYEYCGIINQTTSNIYAKPLNWYYDEVKKTLYITGEGYFNQNILRTPNGEVFEKKLDIDNLVITNGIYAVETNLEVFNPATISLPDGIGTIGRDSLRNLPRIEEITIPKSVINMYGEAFKGCKNLKRIKFESLIPDEVCKGLTSLRFVDFGEATIIGDRAFEGCTNLQEINIPDTITTVGFYAFNKCTAVQEIKIGKNANKIGYFAFAKLPLCEKVTFDMQRVPAFTTNLFSDSAISTTGMDIVLTDNVNYIDFEIVKGVKIGDVTIGKNVSTIKNENDNSSIKSLVVNDNNNFYMYNDCLYSSNDELLWTPKSSERIEIKDSTTAIGSSAFENSNVASVIIPDTVESIGNKAFYNAKSLKRVNIGRNVTSIGESAFENCELLKTIEIPKSVKSIGNKAFYNCVILASVIMSNGIETIGVSAFSNCKALSGIVIPESTLSIGAYAFAGCDELKELYVWNSKFGGQIFNLSKKINVYTMVGSSAYEYCRRYNIPYNAYTDEDSFYDECALKLDILAGYLGFCSDGHGDIQWLTVYDADCDNDGYIIGVCEYCSEILEEKHINASGHNYIVKAEIAATESTRGVIQYECTYCHSRYCEYTPATGNNVVIETHKVSGEAVISTNNTATAGVTPAKNVNIVIDGNIVATTNEKGKFELELTTGVYEAEFRYTYGFTRIVYFVVEDEDIDYKNPIPIIGCDFNKDGKIDNDDLTLFQYVVSAVKNDPSYLDFVDMNNDGYINAKDRAYIQSCKGLDVNTFEYESIVIKK